MSNAKFKLVMGLGLSLMVFGLIVVPRHNVWADEGTAVVPCKGQCAATCGIYTEQPNGEYRCMHQGVDGQCTTNTAFCLGCNQTCYVKITTIPPIDPELPPTIETECYCKRS
jgi:hypothetical protein